ncbi:unnamed protein product [Parajaminaea phylloscopi]
MKAAEGPMEGPVMPPPPPMLLELLGPREHIKFLLPLSHAPLEPESEHDSRRARTESPEESSEDEAVGASTGRPSQSVKYMATIISNVSNADDRELNALLLLDTELWNAVAVLPLLPDAVRVQSSSPTHIHIDIKPTSRLTSRQSTTAEPQPSGNRAASHQLNIEGWSPDILLLQDLRLLLDSITSGEQQLGADILNLSRWMWLKRHCTAEQFAAVKELLRRSRAQNDAPIWGAFSTLLAGSPPVEVTSTGEQASLKVAVATYNVGGAGPPSTPAALGFLSASDMQGADVLAIGFQEVDQSSSAYLWFDSSRQEAWIRVVNEALRGQDADHSPRHWELVAVKQHVTIMLLVYRRTPGRALDISQSGPARYGTLEIDQFSVSSVGVGIGGFLANKGAVGVRFRVRCMQDEEVAVQTSVCLVTAHLSAGSGRIAMERRIWDWTEIQKRISFAVPATGSPESDDTVDTNAWGDRDDGDVPRLSMSQHEHAIVFGDLNSRLPLSLSSHQVKRLLRRGKAGTQILQDYDELKGALTMANEGLGSIVGMDDTSLMLMQSWRGWHEADLAFAPTYKFDVGTTTYDTSEKQRVPSWTDRVLAHSSPMANETSSRDIEIQSYQSHPEALLSDHKPVTALLEVPLKASATVPASPQTKP